MTGLSETNALQRTVGDGNRGFASYTIESRTNLVSSGYAHWGGFSGPTPNATNTNEFYRVGISFP